MEGDAGAERRLNLTDADDSSRSEVTPEDSKKSEGGADQTSTEVTPEDSKKSEGGADQTSTEVTPEDSEKSEGGADQTTRGDARGFGEIRGRSRPDQHRDSARV